MKKYILLSIVSLLSLTSWAQETCPNDEIWYTSSDGQVVTPNKTDVFGATIVSNTYSGGKGIIKFNGNVTSIGNKAFFNCSGLTSITIPNSVTTIGEASFYGCSSLTSIEIPSFVTKIGDGAFYYCSGLTSIIIPKSVTKIGDDMFYECSGLKSIEIPDSVTSIGNRAFYGCAGLTSITIPNSVTSIGGSAFSNCSSLQKLYVNWETPLSIAANVFSEETKNKCTLYVPVGCVSAYMESSVWSEFTNIKENTGPTPELKCDVNGDGVVDVADITAVANYILTKAKEEIEVTDE